ncbi:MAG: aspartate ammonia-lyase [Planctomycetes bacterium]|nr:aspartate ammonia-lyase [Planctomycetota bacterium]MDP6424019.1 class II fumarate hydratase [Planctomycetota bacterium]
MSSYRAESDSMGEMSVPEDALYGAQTARAVDNFPVSGYALPEPFLRALGLIKHAAALANGELGGLDEGKAEAIAAAALEVWSGGLLEHFPIDIFQTGSGTSTNMNANEVIANRATEILGGARGDKSVVHPNDDVNRSQSSNDVIPTALHVATLVELTQRLAPALTALRDALAAKAVEFEDVVTVGRTHLMDATPIRRGQAFAGYASQVEHALRRIVRVSADLEELAIGGTAVGTGLNRATDFPAKVIAHLNRETGLSFREAEDRFEAMGGKDAMIQASGVLRTTCVGLSRIAHDIRQLGSGPRCGIFELELPAVAPGSSIMPGKVNPVMSESLIQVCAWVIGNDIGTALGGLGGLGSNYELNTMMPLLAHNVLESIRVLSNCVGVFTTKCVAGIEANRDKAQELVDRSLMNVTKLAPVIGYDEAAAIAKEAFSSGRTLKEVVLEKGLVPAADLDALLDPGPMTEPG